MNRIQASGLWLMGWFIIFFQLTLSPATPPTTDDCHAYTLTKNPAALNSERGGVGCDALLAVIPR
jgi:hypothetical protein